MHRRYIAHGQQVRTTPLCVNYTPFETLISRVAGLGEDTVVHQQHTGSHISQQLDGFVLPAAPAFRF